jgi:hypothetical protein
MLSRTDWPHTLADAIGARIIRWDGSRLGVSYTFPGDDKQAHQIGTEDRAALRRLERAGKLEYVDQDARERYETMLRAGLFG